jgi:hypothetical protein
VAAGLGGFERNSRSIDPQNAKSCRPLNEKRPQLTHTLGPPTFTVRGAWGLITESPE